MSPRAFAIPVVLAGLLLGGCNGDKTAPQGASQPASVVVSQVRLDRDAIDPEKQETATVRFHLNEAATVALSFFDGRDRLVHRVEAALEAGDRELKWDGKDGKGAAVPAEAYTYTLTARNAKGQTVHDLTDLTGGQAITAKDVRWDPADRKIHYYLGAPARVNLRLGLQDGPYLRTLVDWVPRKAGANAETWDGSDASGVLDLGENSAVAPSIKAYSLPDNTLFVGAPPVVIRFASEAAAATRARAAPQQGKQMFNHAQQPLDTRGDITALLTVGGGAKQDAQGRWIVSGNVPFRADVAPEQRQRAIDRRFEAVFYVDGVFTHENELGYLPLAWTWDTTRINPGEHFITLNIRGYEGNFGAATVKVVVEGASVGPVNASDTLEDAP